MKDDPLPYESNELLALTEQATPLDIARRDRFWTGIVYFRERRWNEAFAEFNRARHENGAQDEPLQWYLRRKPAEVKKVEEKPEDETTEPTGDDSM